MTKISLKHLSIVGMISMTAILTLMDVKDLYYKVNMCGMYPTFSFILQTPETVTDYDMTAAIRAANGTWLAPNNMWNALAMHCDALYPSALPPGKPAHLSSLGVNCTLGGVKHTDERMFIGAHRLDTFMWATGMLADLVHTPLESPPYTNGMYGTFFNLDERAYRLALEALILPEDVPAIQEDVRRVNAAFGSRMDLWGTALCYETLVMVPPGEHADMVGPVEHGCIWRKMGTDEVVEFFVGPTTGKYYRRLDEIMGLHWHTTDYLSIGSGVFLRAKMNMKSFYNLQHTVDGQKLMQTKNTTNLGFDGVLYFVMILVELLIIYINATDSAVVALNVVRPLIGWSRSSTYSTDSKVATTSNSVRDRNASGPVSGKDSMHQNQPIASQNEEKTSTLSKMLLYTDLTSIAYRKPLLTALVAFDTILAWLYIVPNSNVFAWSSSVWQLGSAYLSMFRVWVVVLIIIDRSWRWVFVVLHEKLAALITEFTFITSLEIVGATIVGVCLSFNDIMNITVTKYGIVDGQRILAPSSPTILCLYGVYSRYSWGDSSDNVVGFSHMYYPLGKIIGYGVLFSFLVLLTRLLVTLGWRFHKGTLGGEVEAFWRSYQRNSAEVYMDNPLRANALIRSQSIMSYRFGKSVFIRPFVYLEQNYYITRGKFRQRPDIPFLHNEDASGGADVDIQSYMIAGVFRDEKSHKLQKKMRGRDVQIPLC